jgi:hypothetical protein
MLAESVSPRIFETVFLGLDDIQMPKHPELKRHVKERTVKEGPMRLPGVCRLLPSNP